MRIASRLCLAAALCVGASAHAELVYGLTSTGGGRLISFDTSNITAQTNIAAITGVTAGHALRGIDFRPSDGQLYAVSTANSNATAAQLYTINLTTGVATAVGSGFTLTGNVSDQISLDFNPVANALRVVTGSAQSYRVNANVGTLIAQDTSIAGNPLISGIAYTNNVAGATQTTLYAYNFDTDVVGTIGGANGVPSPNGGTFNVVGSSGVVTFGAGVAGFDISGATGDAYFTADSPGSAANEFYRMNLSTGVLTQIGPNDAFSGVFDLLDISIAIGQVPTPATLALTLAALGLLASTRRRQPAAPLVAA